MHFLWINNSAFSKKLFYNTSMKWVHFFVSIVKKTSDLFFIRVGKKYSHIRVGKLYSQKRDIKAVQSRGNFNFYCLATLGDWCSLNFVLSSILVFVTIAYYCLDLLLYETFLIKKYLYVHNKLLKASLNATKYDDPNAQTDNVFSHCSRL